MSGPTEIPEGADLAQWLRGRMFDRRAVLLSGSLDDEAANRAGLELMTLDATGDEAVALHLDSGEGTVDAALALMDVIDLLGVPVHASASGQAAGPALGVMAVCHRRTVAPHTRVRLYEPPLEVQGNAAQIQQWVALHGERWRVFCARLAAAAGRPVEEVRADFEAGRFLTAAEAVTYGLADEVAAPDARVFRLPPRPMGFGRPG